METKIRDLILQHKNSKSECWELIQELNGIKEQTNLSKEVSDDVESVLLKAREEYSWRGIFIQDLEELLS